MKAEVKPIRLPVLRVFAWIAALLLIVGWASLLLGFYAIGHSFPTYIFFPSHLGALVIGLASFQPLGGISAGLAALTLTVWFSWASAISGAS